LSVLGDIQTNWYPVTSFISSRNQSYNLDVTSPSPVSTGVGASVGESVSNIAKYGKYGIVSLGGKTKRDTIEGFGVQRYSVPISGAVGDQFPSDYSQYEIIGIANSVDGTIELPKALKKYNRVEMSIVNPAFINVGAPHWVLEDTMEWINSGMPSHLSQVHHSNIICGGIAGERISPGLLNLTAPAYQAEYVIPCNSEWYDKVNSTVDYNVFVDFSNRGLSIPYANSVISVPEMNSVFAGGYGGVLVISTVTKEVNRLTIKPDRPLLIKDMKKYNDLVYMLDESKLYILNTTTGKITADTATGLADRLHSFAVIFGSNLVIGAKDGIYARKAASTTWKKVVSISSPVNIITSPDAVMAVADNGEAYYSTDGFNWSRSGVVNDSIVNKVQKHLKCCLEQRKAFIRMEEPSIAEIYLFNYWTFFLM
jgi:hypothetical protein